MVMKLCAVERFTLSTLTGTTFPFHVISLIVSACFFLVSANTFYNVEDFCK